MGRGTQNSAKPGNWLSAIGLASHTYLPIASLEVITYIAYWVYALENKLSIRTAKVVPFTSILSISDLIKIREVNGVRTTRNAEKPCAVSLRIIKRRDGTGIPVPEVLRKYIRGTPDVLPLVQELPKTELPRR